MLNFFVVESQPSLHLQAFYDDLNTIDFHLLTPRSYMRGKMGTSFQFILRIQALPLGRVQKIKNNKAAVRFHPNTTKGLRPYSCHLKIGVKPHWTNIFLHQSEDLSVGFEVLPECCKSHRL